MDIGNGLLGFLSFITLARTISILIFKVIYTTEKVSKYEVFSGLFFPVLSRNTGKYGPEITLYLYTFDAVKVVCENGRM